ncbi:MAG: protease modulator HflK [Chthoniobacteraceae bacterium]
MNSESSATEPDALAPLSKEALQRSARTLWWLFFTTLAGTLFGLWVVTDVWVPAFSAAEMLLFWCSLALLAQNRALAARKKDLADADYNEALRKRREEGAPGQSDPLVETGTKREDWYRIFWQWWIYGIGGILLLIMSLPEFSANGQLAAADPGMVRIGITGFVVMACLLYFFTNYAATVQQRVGVELLTSSLALTRVTFLGCLLAAVAAFIFQVAQFDANAWVGWLLYALVAILMVEPLFGVALRFYQPKALRTPPRVIGSSILLDVLFGRKASLREGISALEGLLGIKVGEVWVFRYVRESFEAILVGSAILGWLSTCLTAVPTGSQGVRVVLGRYDKTPLPAGLQVTWPWPIGQIEVVDSERVRDFSLGYDKDLSGPILWDESHFSGEKNLLVGDGETMLSINVPIFYRISDPVQFLQTANNVDTALRGMAERKLMEIAHVYGAFQIMTDDRELIAQKLQEGLQTEVTKLGLGLQILFVGMKDVHPPVDVAPAYQNVVSAEEQKQRMIDEANAYTARTLPAAQAQADRLEQDAQAQYATRVDQSKGESDRFLLVRNAAQEAPDLFRFRVKMDADEEALATPVKIILATPAQRATEYYLDLRNTGEIPPP